MPDPARLVAAARDPFLRREKPRERMAAELAEELAGVADADTLMRRLRAYRARDYIRLGARECGLGDPAEVGRELAALADVTLEAAVSFHDRGLAEQCGERRDERGRADMVVFGMGKLGGEELNFSSDVDLIFVYSSDAGSAGTLSLHEYFDKLARRVTRTIGEATEDGAVVRVDLRLRPEGPRGPLVNSRGALERYHATWRRQRARTAARRGGRGRRCWRCSAPSSTPGPPGRTSSAAAPSSTGGSRRSWSRARWRKGSTSSWAKGASARSSSSCRRCSSSTPARTPPCGIGRR